MRTTTAAAGCAVVVLALGLAGCSSATAGHAAYAPISCDGHDVVAPSHGPYCYRVPAGFRKGANGMLGDAKFPAAILINDTNIIASGIIRAPADTDTLSDSQLLAANDQAVAQFETSLQFRSRHGQLFKAPNARVIGYSAQSTSNGATIRLGLFFAFKGHSKLQINCQYTDMKSKVETGCQQVLKTLQLASIS